VRIAFITSSLEPGQDGVGDYTRRLAAECIRQGHPSIIAGLNDSSISQTIRQSQKIEGTGVSVLRLPKAMPWSERTREARDWVNTFKPDWVSLQFVPFGFHPKGLCFGLERRLATINPRGKWHIMFHELWLGLGDKAPVKFRLWGTLQRMMVRKMTNCLHPQMVHTQAEPYRKVLDQEGIKTSILPLFSNIPRANGNGGESPLPALLAEAIGPQPDRAKLYLAGVLGAVHPEWNAEQTVNVLLPLVQRSQKRLVLVFLGRNHLTPAAFDQLKSALQHRADVVVTGERTSDEISRMLQSLDLGLATSPRQIIQKSGSAAALLDHGLPVLVTRDDWRLRGPDASVEKTFSRLLSPHQFARLDTLPMRNPHLPEGNTVKKVADRMLASLQATGPVNRAARL